MHGPEFYANKRHKGNGYHDHPSNNSDRDTSSNICQPTTPKTPHSVSTIKSELDHSPAGPMSSPEEHNNSGGSGDHRGSSHGSGMMASNVSAFIECNQGHNLPLSDNNVTTTHKGDIMPTGTVTNASGAINWEMNQPEDINVSSYLRHTFKYIHCYIELQNKILIVDGRCCSNRSQHW